MMVSQYLNGGYGNQDIKRRGGGIFLSLIVAPARIENYF